MQPGDFTKTNKATPMKRVDGKLYKREKGTKIHCYMAQGSACTPAGKVIRKKAYGQTVQEATEKLYKELEYLATFVPGRNPTTDLSPSSTLLEGFNRYYEYAKTVSGLKANTLVGYDCSFKALPESCKTVSLEIFTPGMLESFTVAPIRSLRLLRWEMISRANGR